MKNNQLKQGTELQGDNELSGFYELEDPRITFVTFDIFGKIEGRDEDIMTRNSGIVTLTHNLLKGLSEVQDPLSLSVTRNIVAGTPMEYYAITPEGLRVKVNEISTGFSELFLDSNTGQISPALVKHYYEDTIRNPDNPVYKFLAQQYSEIIRNNSNPTLILQNTSSLVGLLKVEENEELDSFTLSNINASIAIHDIEGYENRLRYAAECMKTSVMNLKIIAGSTFMLKKLIEFGFPEERIYRVPYGFDIEKFEKMLNELKKDSSVFNKIQERNNLPKDKKLVIVPARRVRHKGHQDIIEAIRSIKIENPNIMSEFYVAFSGATMSTFGSKEYEYNLRSLVQEYGLEKEIYFLDTLSSKEISSLYVNANISLLPSTEPEGFGYANLEAMLA